MNRHPDSAVQAIQHIGITVKDIESSLKFYEWAFGLTSAVVASTPRAKVAFLSVGATILEFVQYFDSPDETEALPPTRLGSLHLCFEVDNLQDVFQRLTAGGVEFDQAPVEHTIDGLGRFLSAFLRDPDQARLDLFERFRG